MSDPSASDARTLPAFALAPDEEWVPEPYAPRPLWRQVGALLVALIVLAAVLAAAVALGIGARTTNNGAVLARARATAAVREMLDSGEHVEAQIGALQRHWWDFFVPSYGVLTVTPRRVIVADISPLPGLLARTEPAPLTVSVLRYDSIVSIRPELVFSATARGIDVGTSGGRVVLAVERRATSETIDSIVKLIANHATLARVERQCEARLQALLAAPPPMRPDTHTVQRGDALVTIAHDYQTSVAELKRLNGLTSDEVRIGQPLVVRLAVDSAALRAHLPVCKAGPETAGS